MKDNEKSPLIRVQKISIKLSRYKFKKLAEEAFLRDGYTCQMPRCMIMGLDKIHPHHIIPKGRLHLDILGNILTICFACHRELHDGLLEVSIDDLIDKYNMRRYLHTNPESRFVKEAIQWK